VNGGKALILAMVGMPVLLVAVLFVLSTGATPPPASAAGENAASMKSVGVPGDPARGTSGGPVYAENRATAELAKRGLVPAPGSAREPWTGAYHGPLYISSLSGSNLEFDYELTERADGTIALRQPGLLACNLMRSPANANVAACTGSYSVSPAPSVQFDLAAAMHGGALSIVVITADSQFQGMRIPGTTVAGTLPRAP
jgi:hypothetical protein